MSAAPGLAVIPGGLSSRPDLRNLEAEQNVLGCLLYDNDRLDDVSALLEGEPFSEGYHQRIYDALRATLAAGRRADPTTVIERLKADPACAEFGGLRYLGDLVDKALAWGLRDHAAVLADLATRRALVAAAEEAAATAGDPERDGQALISDLEARLADVSSIRADDAWLEAGDCVAAAIEHARTRDGAILYTWGIDDLDVMTGGLNAGESVIVAGRPGMMKTGVAARIALANARKGLGTCFYSLEMAAHPIGLRLACAVAHRRNAAIYGGQPGPDSNPWYVSAAKGQLYPEQWEALDRAKAEIAKLPLRLDVRAGLTVSRIEAAARRAHRKWRKQGIQPGPVIVDHLGIVRPEKQRGGSKHAETADVSRALAEMAKRLGVPVVALCQLSRGVEGRDDKRPVLSDLRQAGEIEEDARAVVMIYRPAYYLRPPLDPSMEGPAEAAEREAKLAKSKNELLLLVEKNSHGPTGQVEAWCDPATSAVGNRLLDEGARHG